jgi:hypothetical protein
VSEQTQQLQAAEGRLVESEQQLVLMLLLGLRKQGVEEVDNTRGGLHRAFGKLIEHEPERIRRAVGHTPVEHPLFGAYAAIDEALDEGQRGGVLGFLNPKLRRIRFEVAPRDAAGFLSREWSGSREDLEVLTQRFAELCKDFSRGTR